MPTSPSNPPAPESERAARWWLRPFRRLLAATPGELAATTFLVCGLSGLTLAQAYEPGDAPAAIARWLLGDPLLVLARNLHAWSALACAASTTVVLWQRLSDAPRNLLRQVLRGGQVLTLPVLGFLLVSGFLLRGDADARATFPLVADLFAEVPFFGPLAAARFREAVGGDLGFLLRAHTLLAPAVLLVAAASLFRKRPLRPWPCAGVLLGLLLVALVLSPGLNTGSDRPASGPWTLAGIGFLLRIVPAPALVVAVGCAALWFWWALPRFAPTRQPLIRAGLLGALGLFAALTCWGTFGSAPSEPGILRWPSGRGDWQLGVITAVPSTVPSGPRQVPSARGRPEGCLICHPNTTGLSASHRPEAIGCAICHGGNPSTLVTARAHDSLIRVPGNLADAPLTCGTTGCHADIVPRVERSIMATFSGVIAVNRRTFGEPDPRSAPPPHVRDLGHSAADSHLRQLCVSCHLGQEKVTWGPITQESRGGGCNACHLVYSPAAATALDRYENAPLEARRQTPAIHPTFTLHPENSHCFGCHSRSGRISTSYEGWHELREPPSPAELASDTSASPRFRLLDDGRYFVRVTPDVHQARGMDCIDCHTSSEIMGSGQVVRRKSDALQVRCEDCHAARLASLPPSALDAESHKLLGLRQWTFPAEQRFGTTRSGSALANVLVDADGTGRLRRKRTGESRPLLPPATACQAGAGHDRLSCASCHTAWAPRCATCHTNFDPTREAFDHLDQREVRGAWIERSGAFEAAPPTLGLRHDPADTSRPAGTVDTFVPGMVLELDRNRQSGAPADPVFHRLYAHTAAHTITREARPCRSCHNDPVALGFGRGALEFTARDGIGRWSFVPSAPPSAADGLPADAWTGFLQTRRGQVSTRDDVRPFSAAEQRRILNVGACLTCHSESSPLMLESIRSFADSLARRSPACLVPTWPE